MGTAGIGIGVHGSGLSIGVEGVGPIGVAGTGATYGVYGYGATGVYAQGTDFGILISNSISYNIGTETNANFDAHKQIPIWVNGALYYLILCTTV